MTKSRSAEVYKITNKINGKIYIGKSINPVKRWKEHQDLALSGSENCPKLYRAMRKYGLNNFEYIILEKFPTEEAAWAAEIEYIKQFDAVRTGYNCVIDAGLRKNYNHSEETREKLTLARKGKKASPETKKKMSLARKGRKMPEKTKQKISQANDGENNGMYGKTHSEATKKKMSKSQQNRKRPSRLTPEHKLKIKTARSKQDAKYRISKEIKQKVINDWENGCYTKPQLSDKYGIKYNTIVKIIRVHNKTKSK